MVNSQKKEIKQVASEIEENNDEIQESQEERKTIKNKNNVSMENMLVGIATRPCGPDMPLVDTTVSFIELDW